MVYEFFNANPVVYKRKERQVRSAPTDTDESAVEPIDHLEVFDHLRNIKDPEHPYSLEQLRIISEDAIEVDNHRSSVRVAFTPTVNSCGMALVIALCLCMKLIRSLPSHYKVDIRVAPGSHSDEATVNKQVNDKERVAASQEQPLILDLIDHCLAPSYD